MSDRRKRLRLQGDVVDNGGRPVVHGLPVGAARRLTASAEPVRLPRGAPVFAAGERAGRVFLIVRGTVGLGRPGAVEGDPVMTLQGPGDLLGELSVFDGAPHQATARALTAVELLSLGPADFRRWLRSEPDAAWHLLAHLAGRLRRAHGALEDRRVTDVRQRIARALLDLSARFGERTPAGTFVRHGLTQAELARHIGVSRGSVNRALAELAELGLVRLSSRALLVMDAERLRQRAAGS